MALGTGSRYDPATGERQDYEFEYTPASQLYNNGGGMQFDMRKAMEQLGIKQAEQAMIAATRFQGQRGYQQDLQRGEAPDRALAKWAPLMFFGSSTSGAGSMINALKPQQMSPYQQGMLDVANKRLTMPRPTASPQNWEWIAPTNGQPGHFKDRTTGKIRTVAQPGTQTISPSTAANIILNPVNDAFAQSKLGTDYTNLVNIAKSGIIPQQSLQTMPVAQPAPASPQASPTPIVPASEVRRFDSEEEARKAGAKNGDIVYLKGVGKVRLK